MTDRPFTYEAVDQVSDECQECREIRFYKTGERFRAACMVCDTHGMNSKDWVTAQVPCIHFRPKTLADMAKEAIKWPN